MPRAPRGIAAADADEEAKPKQEEKKQKQPRSSVGEQGDERPARSRSTFLSEARSPLSAAPCLASPFLPTPKLVSLLLTGGPTQPLPGMHGCESNPETSRGRGGGNRTSTEQREQRTPQKPQARTRQHHPQLETPSPGGGGSPPEVSHMLSSVRCLSISKLAV